MLSLSPAQRRFLRAQAHALQPVVMIGEAGLTDAVLKELERSLASHELIKVKVHGESREDREQFQARICQALSCTPVQHIGKILVIYKPAKKPVLRLP